MTRHISLFSLTVSVLFVVSCGADSNHETSGLDSTTDTTNVSTNARDGEREITVYAAASLRQSLEELGPMFQRGTGTVVRFNFAGSNELAKQIVAAPGAADVYLSAAENWMDTVELARRVVGGTRRVLLSNALVVVASVASEFAMNDPCDLATIDMKTLALGDPESVPAGKYAKNWLAGIRCDGKPLWDELKDNVAPTPDVRAALGLVLADPQFVGIVYRTDQLAFKDKTKVLHVVKDGPPIRYVVAQLTEGRGGGEGKTFAEYLRSSDARLVFERHGFIVTNDVTNAR